MPGTRPPAIQHDPSRERLDIAGHDDGPATPYPIYLHGWVTRGFGRGSKDLGCPTANLPDSSIQGVPVKTGVHFGYARVLGCGGHAEVYPMVMSIGWNPFYNNDTRTAEVHVLHDYPSDFYGKELRVVMLGFIRPEYNYASLDALIKDINHDKVVAATSVQRPAYSAYSEDAFFSKPTDLAPLPAGEDPSRPREKPQQP
ncbi:putative Riboflavin kinase [Rhodotorula taiwanensis]|uniref:Riboflavin kinase n=1 Tax=Rhodotorula taiwanensis TaxID=741276 RepID=A0A2S5BGG3_9BASI|nr:putative Riboflavin kinase [Rhodotorula taiwanensis]